MYIVTHRSATNALGQLSHSTSGDGKRKLGHMTSCDTRDYMTQCSPCIGHMASCNSRGRVTEGGFWGRSHDLDDPDLYTLFSALCFALIIMHGSGRAALFRFRVLLFHFRVLLPHARLGGMLVTLRVVANPARASSLGTTLLCTWFQELSCFYEMVII